MADDRCWSGGGTPSCSTHEFTRHQDKNPTSVLREFYGREIMRVDLVWRETIAPVFFVATVPRSGWATWATFEAQFLCRNA